MREAGMHELSIAAEVVEIVSASLADYPGARVSSVSLRIGTHSGVVSEALEFCFPLAAEGTPVEGAALQIEPVPLKIRCHDCGAGPVAASSIRCPECGSLKVSVETGREIEIPAIDLEVPDEAVAESMTTSGGSNG